MKNPRLFQVDKAGIFVSQDRYRLCFGQELQIGQHLCRYRCAKSPFQRCLCCIKRPRRVGRFPCYRWQRKTGKSRLAAFRSRWRKDPSRKSHLGKDPLEKRPPGKDSGKGCPVYGRYPASPAPAEAPHNKIRLKRRRFFPGKGKDTKE